MLTRSVPKTLGSSHARPRAGHEHAQVHMLLCVTKAIPHLHALPWPLVTFCASRCYPSRSLSSRSLPWLPVASRSLWCAFWLRRPWLPVASRGFPVTVVCISVPLPVASRGFPTPGAAIHRPVTSSRRFRATGSVSLTARARGPAPRERNSCHHQLSVGTRRLSD